MEPELISVPARQELPGEYQRLREAPVIDQNGMLTATLRRLGRLARARGVESCDIDDVVQETLLEAWAVCTGLRIRQDFPPGLTRYAVTSAGVMPDDGSVPLPG